MIGTNVDPGNFTDLDKLAQEIASHSFTWVRSVYKPSSMDWVLACHDHELKVLLVVARESPQIAPTVSAADAWQIGNEADHVSGSSWTLPGTELSAMGRRWRSWLPATTLVCSGMVSGHPEYLDGVDLSVFDAIAVHPYGRHPAGWAEWGFGPVKELIDQYKRFWKPIWITEFGAPPKDFTGGQGTRADYYGRMTKECAELYAACFPFKYEDQGVPGFGMVGTPALAAVSAVALSQREASPVAESDTPSGDTQGGDMSTVDLDKAIDDKAAALAAAGTMVGKVYKRKTTNGTRYAFCDAGVLVAEPGVPGAYLLKDFP